MVKSMFCEIFSIVTCTYRPSQFLFNCDYLAEYKQQDKLSSLNHRDKLTHQHHTVIDVRVPPWLGGWDPDPSGSYSQKCSFYINHSNNSTVREKGKWGLIRYVLPQAQFSVLFGSQWLETYRKRGSAQNLKSFPCLFFCCWLLSVHRPWVLSSLSPHDGPIWAHDQLLKTTGFPGKNQ